MQISVGFDIPSHHSSCLCGFIFVLWISRLYWCLNPHLIGQVAICIWVCLNVGNAWKQIPWWPWCIIISPIRISQITITWLYTPFQTLPSATFGLWGIWFLWAFDHFDSSLAPFSLDLRQKFIFRLQARPDHLPLTPTTGVATVASVANFGGEWPEVWPCNWD